MGQVIGNYLKFTGFQELTRQVFKGFIRADPKRHAQYIAYMNHRIDLEMDLFERMHKQKPSKAEPETTDASI